MIPGLMTRDNSYLDVLSPDEFLANESNFPYKRKFLPVQSHGDILRYGLRGEQALSSVRILILTTWFTINNYLASMITQFLVLLMAILG